MTSNMPDQIKQLLAELASQKRKTKENSANNIASSPITNGRPLLDPTGEFFIHIF